MSHDTGISPCCTATAAVDLVDFFLAAAAAAAEQRDEERVLVDALAFTGG